MDWKPTSKVTAGLGWGFIAMIAIAALTACAIERGTPAQTPGQALFDAQIYFNGAAGAVAAYVRQPRCVPGQTLVVCRDPDVTRALQEGTRKAKTALDTAKAAFKRGERPDIAAVRQVTQGLINRLYREGKITP